MPGFRTAKPKDALDAALRLLSVRARSVREVRDKLAAKGFTNTDIERAVGYLIDTGYLDDAAFASAFAGSKSRMKGWGPRKIEAELAAKGVSKELIADALACMRGPGEREAAAEAFKKWLKKNRLSPPLERKDTARALRFLQSRGFSAEAAYGILKLETGADGE